MKPDCDICKFEINRGFYPCSECVDCSKFESIDETPTLVRVVSNLTDRTVEKLEDMKYYLMDDIINISGATVLAVAVRKLYELYDTNIEEFNKLFARYKK